MEDRVVELILNHNNPLHKRVYQREIELGMDWREADLTDINFQDLDLSSTGVNQQADFEGARIRHGTLTKVTAAGANFKKVDFLGAKMQGSIFDYSDFTDSNLSHTDLTGSNFRNTVLDNANLSYARMDGVDVTKASLKNADLQGVDIDKIKGLEFAEIEKINESNPPEAKLTYLRLEKYFRTIGFFSQVGKFYYRRKVMEGKEHKFSNKRLRFYGNTLFRFLCGYGEKPLNVLILTFLIIVFCALGYINLGGPYGEGKGDNIVVDSIYFSGVTFTTLGFGDLHPNASCAIMKILATSEAYLGIILMPLFIVCLSRKLIR